MHAAVGAFFRYLHLTADKKIQVPISVPLTAEKRARGKALLGCIGKQIGQLQVAEITQQGKFAQDTQVHRYPPLCKTP